MSKPLKTTFYFLIFLAITLTCANSARILDEVDQQPPIIIADTPFPFNPAAASVPPTADDNDESDSPLPEPEIPVVAAAPPTVDDDLAPIPTPIATSAPLLPTATSTSATVANPGPQSAPLCFFMHDILGGTHPSARVVTGIIASTEINGIPFSKSNNNLFPIGGTALINQNNLDNVINPNNVPFLTGLNGAQASTVLQNTGNNNVVNGNNNNQPFVSAGQLPSGSSLQELMFGSITVIDDELTEGHELGSGVVGRAQGFYLASSLDGTSQTLALTALLHNGNEHDHDHIVDSISFFGVHRTASPHSHIAVVGGTGKYENAKGYAMVESLHQEDQHTTDGVDTIAKFSVYITDE
ncbi:hypothetical protein LWI28_006765 [Acer negundo]|uniref:Dirigent protein n=1 Tax=Acer negundo TaxID=4023 RepID=A0AAD5NG96_ACENE|nr:hypothetical protein LWI28_006765 [Acer negundo]KAK4835144.1 hypothetical protein QYF36_005873 [Acer negundo]